MSRMARSRFGLVAAGLVALAAVAGCSQEEPGNPVGSPGTSVPSSPKTTTPSQTSSQPNGSAIDTCSLLPDADAARLGLSTPGEPGRIGGMPGCDWTASGKFGVAITSSNKGLSGTPGESVSLPKRKAVQAVDLDGGQGCGIAMEVSASSTVLVIVSPVGGGSGSQVCPQALEIAKIVDARLP